MKPATIRMFLGLISVALVTICISGCSPREPKAGPIQTAKFVHPALHSGSIGRIVFMPLEHRDGIGPSARRMDQQFAASWRQSGQFEVIYATIAERDAIFSPDMMSRNHIDSRQLHACRVQYQADAVLLGRIEDWQSYDPVAIGLQAHLISCQDGSVLWSAGGHFDGQHKAVQQELERWYFSTIGREQRNVSSWRTALMSPQLFSRFVSDQLVADALSLASR